MAYNDYSVWQQWGHSSNHDNKLWFLAGKIGAGPWLDVGCNTGLLLGRVSGGIGIDLCVALHQAHWDGHTVAFASALELPFRDKQFKTVVLCSVLEQIPDWPQALAEARRVGCRVVGTAPVPGASPWGAIGQTQWTASVIPPEALQQLGATIEPINPAHYYFLLD